MKTYVAIDIGGTDIKYGLVDEEGNIQESFSTQTQAWLGGPHVARKAVDIAVTYMRKEDISGVGISTAGMVDIEEGKIFYSGPQIPDYAGVKLKALLEEACGVPCEVENDVNCAGLAESIAGAGKGMDSVVCLTIGTGIGGCYVEKGQVLHGSLGSAMEVGYLKIRGEDFQDLASTTAMTEWVAREKGESKEEWSGRNIFKAAKAGDAVCISGIDRMCDVLGEGIANLCYVLNPSAVILGGGVMQQKEYLEPRLQAAMEKYLLPSIAERTKLSVAWFGNEAGMLGAYHHFRLMQQRRQERKGE